MLKKFVHPETGGDLIVSDIVQIDAVKSEGFVYKCDVERKKAEMVIDGVKVTYDEFIEVTPKKK